MIKGSNHHVMPYESGWCVISEANQRVISHFDSQQEAIEYASQCAKSIEGGVLFHSTPYDQPNELSTVALPQQENLLDSAHLNAPDERGSQAAWAASARAEESFDPLLGFDASYFEI